jgi:hypothetical protein
VAVGSDAMRCDMMAGTGVQQIDVLSPWAVGGQAGGGGSTQQAH